MHAVNSSSSHWCQLGIIICFLLMIMLYLFVQQKHVQELEFSAPYEGYNLPVVPHPEEIEEAVSRLGGKWKHVPLEKNINSSSRGIPKYIWQTMKQVPTSLPSYTKEMFENNPGWFAGVMDDDDVNLFMNSVFANTSLLWAFHKINPKLGAMKADVWRYAVLYVYGGVYVDADASFKATLNNYLHENDGLILSTENNNYTGCYTSDFYLGWNRFKEPSFLSSLPFTQYKLVQWLLISSPRHPVMFGTLRNIVQVIKHLYLKKKILSDPNNRIKSLLCTTGPDLFTATVREMLWKHHNERNENNEWISDNGEKINSSRTGGGTVIGSGGITSNALHIRYAGRDYEAIQAEFEEPDSRDGFKFTGHWNAVLNSGAPLLQSYNS